jgi:hypothetical protein
MAQAVLDQVLSTFVAGYSGGGFIADIVCPPVKVDFRSATYEKYLRKDLETPLDSHIGPRSTANELDYEMATGTYLVKDYALKHPVTWSEMRALGDSRARERVLMLLMQNLLLQREIRVATLLQTEGNYASGNTAAATGVWSDSTKDPLTDLQTAIDAIPSGMEQGTKLVGVFPGTAWTELTRHTTMLGAGAATPLVSEQQVKDMLGLDEILVPKTTKNTANRGQAVTRVPIWDATKPFVIRVPTGEPRDEVGLFAATFRMKGESEEGLDVRRWDGPEIGIGGSEWIQVECAEDNAIVMNDHSFLITGA